MDVSVNNINKNNNNLSFQGVKGEYHTGNAPIFRFGAPPYDKNKEKAELEFCILDYDVDKNELINPETSTFLTAPFDENANVGIPQDFFKDKTKAFAYRYKFTNKESGTTRYLLDSYSKIGIANSDEQMNLVKLWGSYMIDPKTGAMRHCFADSDAILLPDGTLAGNLNTPRNHVNKFGGSTKGLLERIKSGEFDPYRYIIANPDLGDDNTSSHRYWPNNLYQSADLQAFKDINFELYKRGKGYVADGAFTSQGLQSPMLHHALKWGEKSPFFHMFKIDDPKKNVVLGILPDDLPDNEPEDQGYNHVGIRIVNNPNDKKTYKPNQPTYIQFYDDRMSSEKQRNDSTKLINMYDSQPDDIFAITNNNDSIYPYYFEISSILPDYKEKIALFKDRNSIPITELDKIYGQRRFLDFGTFRIGRREEASGASFWDGNRDIVKLNLNNPKAIVNGRTSQEDFIGMENARKYVCGAATYWTETVQSDLILRTAKLFNQNPNEVKNILKRSGVENVDEIFENEKRKYPVLLENKTVADYLKEFPAQSLEFASDLSVIFAEPDFNEIMFKDRGYLDYLTYRNGKFSPSSRKTSLSRNKNVENDIYSTMQGMVNDVINGAMASVPANLKGNSAKYKAYITKTYANEIIRYILANSMSPKAVKDGSVNISEMRKINLMSVAKDASNPTDERNMVIAQIRAGMQNVDLDSITKKIAKEIKNVSLKNFQDAETAVIQAKGGLNWRFDAAKDVGDMDAINSHSINLKHIWDGPNGVIEFWSNFIDRVRKYNPASYVIAEVTDIPNYWDYNNKDMAKNYAFDEFLHNPAQKERDFLTAIGASTNSDYSNFFNKLSCIIGVNPETLMDGYSNPFDRSGNLDALKSSLESFISESQPNNALVTHLFFENHDKPRLLHTLPLDMELYLSGDYLIRGEQAQSLKGYLDSVSADKKKKYCDAISKITGGRTDYENINAKAVAVGMMMYKYFDALPAQISEANSEQKFAYTPQQQEALRKALIECVNGQKHGSKNYNKKRAMAFGTQAYEITLREILTRAGITDNLDDRVRDMRYNMLKEYIGYEVRLWEIVNALVGTPTMFNGMEFAQTGYETKCKNQYVNNRNQILHEDIKDSRFKAIFDKISADSGLYDMLTTKSASKAPSDKTSPVGALREGFPYVCDVNHSTNKKEFANSEGYDMGNLEYIAKQAEIHGGYERVRDVLSRHAKISEISKIFEIDESNARNLVDYCKNSMGTVDPSDNNLKKYMELQRENSKLIDLLPVVKYDDKGSITLSVITNNGIPRREYAYAANNSFPFTYNYSVPSIKLETRDASGKVTKPSPLPDGTVLKKMVYKNGKYQKADDVYKVVNGEVVNAESGKSIDLEDTVVHFYVPDKAEIEGEIKAKYGSSMYIARL